MAKKETPERINPIVISSPDGSKEYTLDFNREAVALAERSGFDIDKAVENPVTGWPDLFFLAFRMHHGPRNGNISRAETDKIFEAWGGLSGEVVGRLRDLYNQAVLANAFVENTEEIEKNSGWKVIL